MDFSKYIKSSMGLEDADTNVEINFNVDTDDNGAPISPVDNDGDESVEAAQVETIEATAEVDKAEDEQEQLEEAQEALESLKLVLDKASRVGGLNEVSAEMCNIALSTILRDKNLVNQITTETAFTSNHGRLLHYQNIVDVSLENAKTLSMEGVGKYIEKIKDGFLTFVRSNKVLIKRANALIALAETHRGEHADSDTVPVNGKTGIKIKKLARKEYDSADAFVKDYNRMVKFFDSIKSPKMSDIDLDNIGRDILELPDDEFESVRGKEGTYLEYEFMGIKVQVTRQEWDLEYNDINKSLDNLPMLTNDQAVEILKAVVKQTEEEKIFSDIMDYLDDYAYVPEGDVHQTLKDEYLRAHYARELSGILFVLLRNRYDISTEVVTYCGHCIQNRSQR